jgi:hypothetical protein
VTALSVVYVEGLVFACSAEPVVGSTGKVGGIAISKVREGGSGLAGDWVTGQGLACMCLSTRAYANVLCRHDALLHPPHPTPT